MTVQKPIVRVLRVFAQATISIVFIGVGIGIYYWLYETRATPSASDPSTTGRLRLLVSEPLEQPVGRRFRAFGQVRALNSADVPARVSATVAQLHPNYREGATVAAGEALVTLDDSDFKRQATIAQESLRSIEALLTMLSRDETTMQRALELAEEDAALMTADLTRVREALANDAAIAREVDRARANAIASERAVIAARDAFEKIPLRRSALLADQARQQAACELAQLSLERAVIRAPMAGVIQTAELDVGELAAPGVLVARVVDPSVVEIPVLLPAGARSVVRIGDRVTVRADRAAAATVEARVTRIAPEDNATTRTMTVYAEAVGTTELAPGAFVEAEVSAASSDARMVLPRRAVSGGRIIIIRDGNAHNLSVEVEFAFTGTLSPVLPDTEWVVLKNALPPQTLVVLDGSRRIKEGAPVVAVRAGEESIPSDLQPDAPTLK